MYFLEEDELQEVSSLDQQIRVIDFNSLTYLQEILEISTGERVSLLFINNPEIDNYPERNRTKQLLIEYFEEYFELN